MKSRYFAFGCSYVASRWGTIADLIGANFDEFYNLGTSGSCNTYNCSRFLEADKIYNFNPETDFITFGVTGYARFSIPDKENKVWLTPGDTLFLDKDAIRPQKTLLFARNLDNFDWAVYRSWCAVKTISEICKSKNLKHVIYPSIDNLLFLTDYDLPAHTIELVKDILDMCDIKESVDEFIILNKNRRGVQYKDGNSDCHPTQLNYYNYLKKHLKQFDTTKTLERYNYLESIFDYDSINTQALNFYKLYTPKYTIRDYKLWEP